MVTAEKNTNPFANGNVQNVCGDASLPATKELRGITPLIDPAVDVDGKAAALSKSSAATPLTADGLSVFDLMSQAGLGDLVKSQAGAGGAAAGGAAQGDNQAAGNNNSNQNQDSTAQGGNQAASGNDNQNQGNNQQGAAADNGAAVDCSGGNAGQDNNQAAVDNGSAASNGTASAGNDNANQNDNAGNDNNNQNQGQAAAGNDNNAAADNGAAAGGASTSASDFGKCTPTMIFEAGQNGRPATEFTFQIADKLARGGQGEALNPDIITNALCNQLTNVCGASKAGVATCESAKAAVKGGPRDKSTADKFNSLMGFAGAVTNPDGGPADKPAGAAAGGAARKMRRGLRM
jgi:hypothetical protein